MALSVGATWGVASVAAAITFAIGTIVAVVLVRRRHRRLIGPTRGLDRGLSAYHRTHLSLDGTNYAHIPPPRTRLRRSAHLPYGVVSGGWADLPSQESLRHSPIAVILEQQDIDPELAQRKRCRSLRATFSQHSFHAPKTRRQKKIDKAIPLNAVGRSPLSAITEISDPNTRDISPAIGAVELPTEVTPTATPPRVVDVLKATRPISAQWPLRNDKRRSQDVLPNATVLGVNRKSVLVRMNSTGHSIGASRVSLDHRSISMASTLSVAPGDPLPPLPTIITTRYPQRNNSKARSSVASTATVGSSVLGTGIFSPSHDGTDQTDFTVESPWMALSPSLVQEYESRPESWGSTAVTMGTPPGTKTSRGLRIGAPAIGSFRASIGNPESRVTSTSQAPGNCQYDSCNGLSRSALTTIDANNRDSALSAHGSSFRKSASPSMPVPIARYGLPYRDGRLIARHSMYEQHTGIGKISFNPDVLQTLSSNGISPTPLRSQPRPASVGNSNPFRWDQNVVSPLRDANLNRSPSSQRRGHKRQNCVRISNLPPVDIERRAGKLPQMAEEDEQLETPTKRSRNISGLRLIPHDDKDGLCKLMQPKGPPSPSPFQNRPILIPTSCARRVTSSCTSSRESPSSSRPNSDVFSADHYDPKTPNIFASRSPDRNWPLSPTPRNDIVLNSTPPAAFPTFPEPYDPQSPILPSPNLLSATLFPRKSTLHGPRSLPSRAATGHGSRTASTSPLQRLSRNTDSPAITTKQRSGDDLRRSVTMLRRMNPDLNNGSQDRVSKIYRNIAKEYGGSLSSAQSRSTSMMEATRNPRPVHEDENLAPLPRSTGNRLTSTLTVGGGAGVRHSNSPLETRHSGSMMSTTGASIWEDVSVRGDSPKPELPVQEVDDGETPMANAAVGVDLEAFENFVGQERMNRGRGSKLTSPQGRGLGLMGPGSQIWGTPASLYDRDGFLKE